MAESTLRVAIDGSRARTDARALESDLDRLKRSGDGVDSSMAKLSRTLGTAFAGFSTFQITKELISAGTAADSLNQKFKAVFGAVESSSRQLAFVRSEADRLGLSVTQVANSYALLSAAAIGTSLEGQKTRDIFSAVSEASAKLGLTTDATGRALNAIQQVISKGTLSAEELRSQLGEALPGAYQAAARGLGLSTEQLGKALEQGQISAEKFITTFDDAIRDSLNTSAETRIDSVAASYARLANEIERAVAAQGKRLNTVVEPAANFATEFLKRGRLASELEGFGPGAQSRFRSQQQQGLRSGQPFQTLEEFVNSERRAIDGIARALTGSGKTSFDVGSLLEVPGRGNDPSLPGLSGAVGASSRSSLFGASLLSSGVEPLSAKQLAAEAKKREQEAAAARRAALKDQTEAERLAEAQARSDAERGERADDLILSAQTQRVELQKQLQTGEQLTAAGRELARLRAGELDATFLGREAAKEQLAIELQGLDTIQKKVAAQDRLNAAASRAAGELQDGPLAAGAAQRAARGARRARRGSIGITFGDIEAQQSAAADSERARFGAQEKALRGGDESVLRRDGLLKENETINDLIERAREEHQARLTEIDADGQQARRELMDDYVGLAVKGLQDVQTVAFALGKRGFAVYKAAAIAETTISTIQGAQNAFTSLSKIPVVGPALGGAAAAAAVVSGLARVAQIRSQNYGGGREFGGDVQRSRFYEIGEKGKPEIINSDGRYYLFGAQGNVIPASQSGGNSSPSVNVRVMNKGAPVNATARTTNNDDGSLDIEIVMDEIAARMGDVTSKIGRAADSRMGTRARGTVG